VKNRYFRLFLAAILFLSLKASPDLPAAVVFYFLVRLPCVFVL